MKVSNSTPKLNPYEAPRTASNRVDAAASGNSPWTNRPAAAGFVLSLLFPLAFIAGLAVILYYGDPGRSHWRMYRAVRMGWYWSAFTSPLSLLVSLAALRRAPRKLAYYGRLLGGLGSSYLFMSLVGR